MQERRARRGALEKTSAVAFGFHVGFYKWPHRLRSLKVSYLQVKEGQEFMLGVLGPSFIRYDVVLDVSFVLVFCLYYIKGRNRFCLIFMGKERKRSICRLKKDDNMHKNITKILINLNGNNTVNVWQINNITKVFVASTLEN